MPSKQANDVLVMEELVHEIKENLRLKARPPSSAQQRIKSARPSPYHKPCRSWHEPASDSKQNSCGSSNGSSVCSMKDHNHHHHHHHRHHGSDSTSSSIDDPYEMLQTLLKSNNLVKEAVRRLQLNISPKQQRYFYDSDEESSRSPILRMCHLEL